MIYQLGDRSLKSEGEHFIAASADIIGDVQLEPLVSIWFQAVLRGDNEPIRIGMGSNIQDGSILHTDMGAPLTLGTYVTVGHKAMLHGCCVGDYSLIGMNAVVLNHARIGRYCLIAANTLISEGREIPDFSLVMGSPGKVIRLVTEAQKEMLAASALHYIENFRRYQRALLLITPQSYS